MTQYLQSGLKDFKNILHTYSLWYKDVLRQFWFQSEKIDFFSKIFTVIKWDQNLNFKPLWGGGGFANEQMQILKGYESSLQKF